MKLFKFICGSDEKIGPFKDETEAYDRRTEIDPTFHFLPVRIEEVTLPGYVISITPIAAPSQFDGMDADQLRAWLDVKGIKYQTQLGDRKLRDLCVETNNKEAI